MFDARDFAATAPRIESSFRGFDAYFDALLEKRLSEGLGDDVFSALIRSATEEKRCEVEDLPHMMGALTSAAFSTTQDQLGTTMGCFVEHP